MYKTRKNQAVKKVDPSWVLLAQHSLGENIQDVHVERVASQLKCTMQELGLTTERINSIVCTATGTAKEARTRLHCSKQNTRIQLRLLCQSKIRTSMHASKMVGKKDFPIIPGHFQEFLDLNITLESPNGRGTGGWGYFLIERGDDMMIYTQESPYIIELYLYKEDE